MVSENKKLSPERKLKLTAPREPRTIDPQLRWYNNVEAAAAHFWVIDVAEAGLKFKALDAAGATRDEFGLP